MKPMNIAQTNEETLKKREWFACTKCKKGFPTLRGLRVHITKKCPRKTVQGFDGYCEHGTDDDSFCGRC